MTDTAKALNVTDMTAARQATSDIEVFGDPGQWVCICKASSKSQGWMKSTKVMNLPVGCVIQTTSEFRDIDGLISVADDELEHIPGAWWGENGWQATRPE